MMLSPSNRRFILTAHLISSLGWVGALTAFLVHSLVSVASRDVQMVRAACLAMGLIAWFVILPFSLVSLATGVAQALGTAWGLLRHYWVATKLVLTLIATAVLLSKLAPISTLGSAAQALNFTAPDSAGLKLSLLIHAAGGLIVLLVATVLAIYKPAGVTPRGARLRLAEDGANHLQVAQPAGTPRWVKAFAIVGLLLVLIATLSLIRGGHGPAAHVQAATTR